MPGAAVSSSVKPDVLCAGSDPGFCFSSPMARRWKAGRRSPSRGQREETTRFIVREQSCPLHDESSGAVVREQSSVRRVGVVGGWRPGPKTSDEVVFFGDLKRGCCSSLNSPSFSTRTKSVSFVFRARGASGATGA